MKRKKLLWALTLFSSFVPIALLFLWRDAHSHSAIWSLYLIPAMSIVSLYPNWKVVFVTTLFINSFKLTLYFGHFNHDHLEEGHTLDFLLHLIISIILMYVISYFLIKNHKVESKLENLANLDPLTGLFNRRYFDRYIRSILEEHRLSERSLVLLALDVDHFKNLNDTFGHHFGDEVLKKLSLIIAECVRESDTVVRMGGEEFVIILPNIQVDEGYRIAERIRQTVERFPFVYERSPHYITVSIGLSLYNSDIETSSSLYCKADEALYEAKLTGRNKVAIHNKSIS